jgi:hypothetical protein
MDMPDDLTAGFIAIIDNAKTIIGKAHIVSNFPRNLEDMTDQFVISGCQVESGADMLAWHDQIVLGGLGINVLKDNDPVIQIDRLTRDLPRYNLTEDAIVRHVLLLP